MLKTQNLPLVETFAQVLETMAFISLVPIEAPMSAPQNPLLVSIAFTGPARGTVEIVASTDFAAMLAANVLGSSPADADAVRGAGDAMKELVNVVCGALLAMSDPTTEFEVGIPTLLPCDATTQWPRFAGSPTSAIFDADGHTIAIRVTGGA